MSTLKNPLEPMAMALGIAPLGPFDHSSVTLTSEETEVATARAIAQARAEKALEVEKQREIDWKRHVVGEAHRPWSVTDLASYVRRRFAINEERELVVDDSNRDLMNKLCYYFNEDPRFEKQGEGFKLSKGLLLVGNVGVGKTTLMRAFASNKRQPYVVVSCRQVAGDFAEHGHAVLDKFAGFMPGSGTGFWHFGHRNIGYCFDDLGTDEEKKHYGNSVNVMGEVLLNRYDQREVPHCATHITTNLSADDIGAYYGNRVRSRLREMFNILELAGDDRRK